MTEEEIRLLNTFIDKLMLCENISVRTDYDGDYRISPTQDIGQYVLYYNSSRKDVQICSDYVGYHMMGLNGSEMIFATECSESLRKCDAELIKNEAFHSFILMYEFN